MSLVELRMGYKEKKRGFIISSEKKKIKNQVEGQKVDICPKFSIYFTLGRACHVV